MGNKTIKNFGLAAIVGIGSLLYLGSERELKTEINTYQGYTNVGEGIVAYVFDDKPYEARTDGADLFLVGDSKYKKELNIGVPYKITYKIPRSKLFNKKIKLIEKIK